MTQVPTTTAKVTRSGVLAGLGALPADVMSLYLRLLPAEFFTQVRQQKQLPRHNNRVYSDGVVIWLMIMQRLLARGSLEAAVLELLCGLPQDFWPKPCKRLQVGAAGGKIHLSSNTASFNESRQDLPLSIVEYSVDQAFRKLLEQVARPGAAGKREAFFVDGSSMRTASSQTLAEQYPPGSNQHGQSHWPLVRIVVAHDLYSGLAMRPEWGPMNGPNAVSEQGLLEQAIDRLPDGCVMVGDANFGVFSVAYAAAQHGHPVVLRLTMARAKHLAQTELSDEMDRLMQWIPSREDRQNHPELPADACVQGRLIVRQVQPGNGQEPFLLAVFTTLLEDAADSTLELYGYRWNIETDLRSLKSTLRLDRLTSTTPEMVAKEIDVAMLAYNLVRAVICLAAQTAGLQPRQFSFTRVRNIVNAFAPRIAAAAVENPAKAQQLFDDMMYYVGQAKIYPRKKKRPSYPRAVWSRPQKYPKRKK